MNNLNPHHPNYTYRESIFSGLSPLYDLWVKYCITWTSFLTKLIKTFRARSREWLVSSLRRCFRNSRMFFHLLIFHLRVNIWLLPVVSASHLPFSKKLQFPLISLVVILLPRMQTPLVPVSLDKSPSLLDPLLLFSPPSLTVFPWVTSPSLTMMMSSTGVSFPRMWFASLISSSLVMFSRRRAWGRVTTMVLPIMAFRVAKAFINIKGYLCLYEVSAFL